MALRKQVQDGNFSVASTWENQAVPQEGDSIVSYNGYTLNMDVDIILGDSKQSLSLIHI